MNTITDVRAVQRQIEERVLPMLNGLFLSMRSVVLLIWQVLPTFGCFTSGIQRCLEKSHTVHAEALQSLLTLNFQTFETARS
jgi:hypothetical protein